MNNYIVHEQDHSYIDSEVRKQEIIDYLENGLQHPDQVADEINSHIHRQIRIFEAEPIIVFEQDKSNNLTILRLKASDNPNLLAKVSHIFIEMGIRVHSAKISTVGADVEDIFMITDRQNNMITDSTTLNLISDKIIKSLSKD